MGKVLGKHYANQYRVRQTVIACSGPEKSYAQVSRSGRV
jgi:hypothetical protein